MLGNYEIPIELNENLQNDNSIHSYLALAAALKKKISESQRHIAFVRESELSNSDYLVYLEAKVVINYFLGNWVKVQQYAREALSISERAFFSRVILARYLTWNKRFPEAEEHYKILLEIYPLDSNVLLDFAFFVLVSKKDDRESLNYVLRAKKSFRRNMYLLLIPLKKISIRLLIMGIAWMLFSMPTIGTFLFVMLSMLILVGAVLTLMKGGFDHLIITRLISLQVLLTGMWFVVLLISNSNNP